MRNTRNPFEYGGVVSGDKFCNRQKEKTDLRKAIRNREKIFVFSERRFGKTSLIKSVLARLPKKQTVAAYVDLWPTESEAAFVTALAKAIAESMTTSAQKLLQIAKQFFGSLAPAVTVNEEGRPEIGFGVTRRAHLSAALDEVLDTPAKIAAAGDRDVVIVFDEFQQILEYGDDRVEKKLRSVIQNHKNVGYIFLGSRKHLIQKMFMDRPRPLYRAGGHYPLARSPRQIGLPLFGRNLSLPTRELATNAFIQSASKRRDIRFTRNISAMSFGSFVSHQRPSTTK